MVELFKDGCIEDFYYIDEDELNDKYGSTATVKQAIKKDTGEAYGLKIIDFDHTDKNLVLNELKIMSLLNHPNIVKIYEFYVDNPLCFIVLEWMGGGEVR